MLKKYNLIFFVLIIIIAVGLFYWLNRNSDSKDKTNYLLGNRKTNLNTNTKENHISQEVNQVILNEEEQQKVNQIKNFNKNHKEVTSKINVNNLTPEQKNLEQLRRDLMNTNREVDTATKVYETAQRFQQISKISNPISSNKVPNKDGKIDIPSRFGNNDNCFYIYITVAIEDQFKDPTLGKIIIKLYSNTPKTSENFISLCENKKYVGTKIHRVIKNFMIQTGDFTNNDGTGGYSIYGKNFADENFDNKHDRPGLISMANSGPNTNGSQFFITTSDTPHLDGKHVVFGEVVGGMEFVFDIENQVTDNNDCPVRKCYISDCGLYDPNNSN